MGKDATEENSKRVRESVKNAIGKITGNAELLGDGAVEKSDGKQSKAVTGTDQASRISPTR